MAFRSFSVGPSKGLRKAACESVPDVMVICGPNGVGKSTLLQLLKRNPGQAEPNTKISYVGPYRTWRRASLYMASLFEKYSYADYLTMDQLPGWSYGQPPGLHFITQANRVVDQVDEAQSLVKTAIAKIALKERDFIAGQYQRQNRQIAHDSIPDIFRPLRQLTEFLLPHLVFHGVNTSEETNVRCDFRRRDGDTDDLIDIDELSSGEKSVIALFLPYLEAEMLQMLETESGQVPNVMHTTLIDEPEIHLHPSLQAALIDFIRLVSADRNHQFILATHSPTLLDAARQDELFVLLPLNVVGDENQLVRVSHSLERLELIRELTGSTHAVTRVRPVVFVEGELPEDTRRVSDQRLIELLVPESESWAVVPSKGKGQVVSAAKQLRGALKDGDLHLPVFALVDLDQGGTDRPEWAIVWPVAMIENLLLDPDAIWELMKPSTQECGLGSVGDVKVALRKLAEAQLKDEVRLRVMRSWPPLVSRFDPTPDFDCAREAERCRMQLAGWMERNGGQSALADLIHATEKEVATVLSEGRELEVFRGKPILDGFFEAFGKRAGFSRTAFVMQLASRVVKRERVRRLTAQAVVQIQRFTPERILSALEDATKLEETLVRERAQALLPEIQRAREQWAQGTRDGLDRSAVRAQIIDLARRIRVHQPASAIPRTLLACVAEMIGD